MVSRPRLAALDLEEFPRLGRTGDRAGARELVVARTPYILVYPIGGDVIEIVRVLHGAQRRPE
jgi:toxin ParE1/3/4